MRKAVEDYLSQIHEIFKKYRLIDVIFDGHYVKRFADQIGHLRPQYNKNGEVDFQQDDLLYLARETRFSVANTILFFEYGLTKFEITNSHYGPVGGFFGREIDNRFFYFVDDVFMRLYNFWNRIANFLNIFFNIEADHEKVYFAPFIDGLANVVPDDSDFRRLKAFRDEDYKHIVNKRRRAIVHRKSSSATYFESFFRNVQNPDELSKLEQERDELPAFFVTSYGRMIQGIDETLAIVGANVKCDTKAS